MVRRICCSVHYRRRTTSLMFYSSIIPAHSAFGGTNSIHPKKVLRVFGTAERGCSFAAGGQEGSQCHQELLSTTNPMPGAADQACSDVASASGSVPMLTMVNCQSLLETELPLSQPALSRLLTKGPP